MFQRRDSHHCVPENWFEMLEVAGDFIKTKIVCYAVDTPGSGGAFEGTDQQLAGIVLVIGAGIVIAQHRKV